MHLVRIACAGITTSRFPRQRTSASADADRPNDTPFRRERGCWVRRAGLADMGADRDRDVEDRDEALERWSVCRDERDTTAVTYTRCEAFSLSKT
jgi:hypothetical protein